MDNEFPCPACGAPNDPSPGASRMPCSYCGVNLSIPKKLQKPAKPIPVKNTPKTDPLPNLEKDAPDLLRKAQPIAIKAWNSYVYWTWLRRLFPACLAVLVIGFFVCAALGALPFVLGLFH